MSRATYFVQHCPTCGRNLNIRVEYLGREVVCQHCRAEFQAHDELCRDVSMSDSLMRRVDELLATVDRQKLRPGN